VSQLAIPCVRHMIDTLPFLLDQISTTDIPPQPKASSMAALCLMLVVRDWAGVLSQILWVGFLATLFMPPSSDHNSVYLYGSAEDYDRWAELVEDDGWRWANTSKKLKEVRN
jgi:hypothetical protein